MGEVETVTTSLSVAVLIDSAPPREGRAEHVEVTPSLRDDERPRVPMPKDGRAKDEDGSMVESIAAPIDAAVSLIIPLLSVQTISSSGHPSAPYRTAQ